MRCFNWLEKAESWECPSHIAMVVQRYQDCYFRDHSLDEAQSAAMKVLARPAPPRTDFIIAFGVREFLRYIRENHPTLEGDLDPRAVAWWDWEIERRRRRSWWSAIIGLPDEMAAFAEELRRG
jgi:hypothetical protein